MSEQPTNSLAAAFPLSAAHGIRVIPSGLVPQGHRFIWEDNCYINPAEYARMQSMSAAEMLLALGLLQKIGRRQDGAQPD